MDSSIASDWDLTKTDAVLLGAGFSACVTAGKAPLMANFFEGMDATKYPSLGKFLHEEYADFQTANVEQVLLALDQISTCPPKLNPSLFSFCRNHCSDIRKDLCNYCIDRPCGLPVQDSGTWAMHLLQMLDKQSTVLTTNYDNLAERILSYDCRSRGSCHHCKMRQILSNECGCNRRFLQATTPSWRGALLKLHGSIAWTRCTNWECCNFDCLSPDVQCQPRRNRLCDSCGSACTPVIVLPSMSKHLDEFPEIAVMWNCAHESLRNATMLLIFGFAFPISDEFFARTVRRSLQENQRLCRIGVIDLDPESVARRISSILPTHHSVNIDTFKVPRDGSTPQWWLQKCAMSE